MGTFFGTVIFFRSSRAIGILKMEYIVTWASACRSTRKRPSTCSKASRYTQISVTNYDLRRNHLLGINVSMCTEIVSKNVLSGSQNPQVQSKPSYKLSFATKSSPGHKRVKRYRNTPKNVLRRSKKLPGTIKFALQAMICDRKHLMGINESMCTKIVLKNVLSES